MTKSPPNARSLTIEYTPWQKVKEIIPLFEFLLHLWVLVRFIFHKILVPFSLIHAYELLNLKKEIQSFSPWNRSLTNLITPVFGSTLDEGIILLLIYKVNQKVFKIILILVQIFEKGADKVI